MSEYWDGRFRAEGEIWGESPSLTAIHSLELFRRNNVKRILIPGSGYGRNSRFFSISGFDTTGVEISKLACKMAQKFDPLSRFYNASVLDMSFDNDKYDAVYCFNPLHLFLEKDRNMLVQQCVDRLKDNGLMYFTVFSEEDAAFGKGKEVEKNTFESKPGRPAHYFTKDDLREHFKHLEIIETGITEDPEDHGQGPHIHILRYIFVRAKQQ
jgi:SAM-dependent methyltransferase